MLTPVASRGPRDGEPFHARLTLGFHGETLRILVDDRETAGQICFNFGEAVLDGERCAPGGAADIRLTRARLGGTTVAPLLAYWSLFSRELCRLLAHRFVFLHASAVAIPAAEVRSASAGHAPPNGALFVGPSGSGKTTLAIAGATLGYRVVSDDVVALEWATGLLRGVPFPLRPRAAAAREALTGLSRTHRPDGPLVARLRKVLLLPARAGVTPDGASIAGRLLAAALRPDELRPAQLLTRIIGATTGCEITALPPLPPCDGDLTAQRTLLARELSHLAEGP